MYIDVVPNRNSPPAVLLREAWREGQKTRKRTVANLSDWPQRESKPFAAYCATNPWSRRTICLPRKNPFRTAMLRPSWK